MVDSGVRTFSCGRQECLTKTASGGREYKRRLGVMIQRQLGRCAMCRKVRELTFDHEAGRGSGGGHRDDRIWQEDGQQKNAALCVECNGLKGSKRYSWIDGVYESVQKEK